MPMLVPLIALVAGILSGTFLEGPLWGAVPFALGLAYYLFLIKKSAIPLKALQLNSRHTVWIFLLFAGIGIFDSWVHRPMRLSQEELQSYIAAEGEITDVKNKADGDRFIVEISRLSDSSGNIRECRNLNTLLYTTGFNANVGDIIVFPVRLEEIADNPNLRPTGYAAKMRRAGILYRSRADASKISNRGFKTGIRSSAAAWRDRIVAVVEKSSLKRETVNFITALVFGDKSFLASDVKETFSNAGVAHILALSGMHVAIIMGIILVLLFPLKLFGLHRLRLWTAVAVLWVYAFFSGMAPSTIRACIMTTFVVAALSMQRRNASGNALLASAFVILLVNPFALYDVGMQLSFLCVACILAFAGQLNAVNRHFHPWLHSATSAVLVSLVATLGTWVLVSYYFKKIPLMFLPVNIILLPLLPVYMSIALAYLALLLLGHDAAFLSGLLDGGYSLFVRIAEWMSAFGESVVTYRVQLPVVIIWLLGVLLTGYALHRNRKRLAAVFGISMAVASLVLVPMLSSPEPDGIIFQKNYSGISVALYDSDNENIELLPRNTISRIIHKGNEIISVDCRNRLDTLASMVAKGKKAKRRYLILGSGFSGKSLQEIPDMGNFDKIILHSSLKRKMESKFLDEAARMGIDKIHSLREEGPLEISF